MPMIKKFVKVFLIIDLGVIIFCLLEENTIWLFNTQIAFASSLMITVGSFLGYKKNIESRVPDQPMDEFVEEADEIDKIDDPFDLYSEEIVKKNDSHTNLKEVIKEEKKKVKQHTFKNLFFSASGFSSIYRLAGYAGLIIGFFYLNNHHLFDVYSYLFGLFIVPLSVLVKTVLRF